MPMTQPAGVTDLTAVLPHPTPWVHAVAGDSISYMYGRRATGSAAFHSLCEVPRAILFDAQGYWGGAGPSGAVNHIYGHNFGVNGQQSGNAGLTHPANLAAIAALNPHSLEIVIGRNDSAGGSTTTATNILVLIDYLRAIPGCRTRAFILHMPLPGTAGVSDGTALTGQGYFSLRAALNGIQQARAGIYLFDCCDLAHDPASVFGPIGGAAGGAGAVLADGVHPSSFLAKAAKDRYTRLLDQIGMPRRAPQMVSPGDFWSASAPGGNLLGEAIGQNGTVNAGGTAVGTFTGSSAYAGTGNSAGITGQKASVWTITATNAELIVNLTKSTVTDPVTGRVVPGQLLTLANAAPLTADRNLDIKLAYSSGMSGRIDPAKRYYAQQNVLLTNPVGLVDMGFFLTYQVSAVNYYLPFGIGSGAASANVYRGDGTKTCFRNYDAFTGSLCMHNSGFRFEGAADLLWFQTSFTFVNGSTPAGSIFLSEAGIWPLS